MFPIQFVVGVPAICGTLGMTRALCLTRSLIGGLSEILDGSVLGVCVYLCQTMNVANVWTVLPLPRVPSAIPIYGDKYYSNDTDSAQVRHDYVMVYSRVDLFLRI